MVNAKYFNEDPISKVIGPQIGPIFFPSGVRITIAIPHRDEIEELTCKIIDEHENVIEEHSSAFLHPKYRNYLFEFLALNSGDKYFYKFIDSEGNALDLEGGLGYGDCYFYGPAFSVEDKFILLSCNNPFHFGGVVEKQFAMWERLVNRITNDRNIKFLIQGGDQVYHDDIESDCLSKLRLNAPDSNGVADNLIKNYQHFYSNLNYRKILAHIPSIAMLDDHDITDGWGGRPWSFQNDGSFKPEWAAFFNLAYDAFKAYQTTKNPPSRIYKGVETTFLEFGENRLYLLDLRKEKNTKNTDRPLISQEHENRILASINDVPENIINIFILCPVVPVRINPKLEEELTSFSTLAYELRSTSDRKMKSGGKAASVWWAILHWVSGLGGFANLSDDLTDGLSSKINKKYLISLLEKLSEINTTKNINSYVLSGDIHVGGISEIFVVREGNVVTIPQIVSSPIGYEPMKKLVKDKTTEEFDYEIQIEKILPNENEDIVPIEDTKITARNVFYRSDRNFAVLKPGNHEEIKPTVEFYFENLSYPIKMPMTFL